MEPLKSLNDDLLKDDGERLLIETVTLWYVVGVSSVMIFCSVIVFILIKRNGSFRFLFENIVMILSYEVIMIVWALTNYFHIAHSDGDTELVWVILYYLWAFLMVSSQYIVLNLIIFRVAFKYWETSRQVVRFVNQISLQDSILPTDSNLARTQS